MPALIRRFHEAKEANSPEVKIWGTGTPRREFLHVDDLAKGLLHLCELENPPDLVNVGTGTDDTIMELAQKIAAVVGYSGTIANDPSKPDGTPVKCTDMSLMQGTGWQSEISLEQGLKQAYQDFLQEASKGLLREA